MTELATRLHWHCYELQGSDALIYTFRDGELRIRVDCLGAHRAERWHGQLWLGAKSFRAYGKSHTEALDACLKEAIRTILTPAEVLRGMLERGR